MDMALGYSKNNAPANPENTRNGYSVKTLKSELGPVSINIPRDRKGEFEPKIVPKYKRNVTGIEEKVISLYARGMTTRDIHDQIKELYGIEISADMVSKITERIIPQIKEWQTRPLERIYTFVFMDAILSKAFDKIASMNVIKKWTQRYRNWDQVLSQLMIMYGERLEAYI